MDRPDRRLYHRTFCYQRPRLLGGGTLPINVTAPTGKGWTAVSNNPSWITVESGASGTGNGTVQLSIPSSTGAKQIGTVTIAGLTYTVTQISPQGSVPLAANFGSHGLWVFQNAVWSQLKTTSPAAMATYGSNLVAAFPGDGLYQYNGTTLTNVLVKRQRESYARVVQRDLCESGRLGPL